jgi:hypothetical protein
VNGVASKMSVNVKINNTIQQEAKTGFYCIVTLTSFEKNYINAMAL